MSQWSDFPAKECDFFVSCGRLCLTEATAAGECGRPAPHSYLSATSQKRSTGLTCDTVPSAQAVNTLAIEDTADKRGPCLNWSFVNPGVC